jgi:hypothetical protein
VAGGATGFEAGEEHCLEGMVCVVSNMLEGGECIYLYFFSCCTKFAKKKCGIDEPLRYECGQKVREICRSNNPKRCGLRAGKRFAKFAGATIRNVVVCVRAKGSRNLQEQQSETLHFLFHTNGCNRGEIYFRVVYLVITPYKTQGAHSNFTNKI